MTNPINPRPGDMVLGGRSPQYSGLDSDEIRIRFKADPEDLPVLMFAVGLLMDKFGYQGEERGSYPTRHDDDHFLYMTYRRREKKLPSPQPDR